MTKKIILTMSALTLNQQSIRNVDGIRCLTVGHMIILKSEPS